MKKMWFLFQRCQILVKSMNRFRLFYDLNRNDAPKKHEEYVARIIADYFQSDIQFIRKTSSRTPDFYILKTYQLWELKSPLGNGKRTIANNLREASKQSRNIILDLSRCKMNNSVALSRIRGFLSSGDAHINRLIVIDKSRKIIDFSPKKR